MANSKRGVSRAALSGLLRDAALAHGVQLRYDSAVDGIVSESERAALLVNGAGRPFDLAVIADGATSRLPEQAGLSVTPRVYEWGALWAMFDVDHWPDPALLEQRYRTTRKMFGLMPTEQAGGTGLWRDVLFAAGLKVPGVRHLMYRSIAAPPKAYLSNTVRVDAAQDVAG